MGFYHDKQGFVQCTVGELKETLQRLPDDHVLMPTVTYDKGVVLSVQTPDADDNWFVGWIDFSDGHYRPVARGTRDNANPVYGPCWSFKPDSLTEIINVNANYPPVEKDEAKS
jgi:hypothetical protein